MLAMQAVARRSICAGIVLIAVILKFNHADADVTNNSREFRRVRDLATENWTA
jgi:predicted nucleic acid-binding protein